MSRNTLPWFPLDAVELLTEADFAAMCPEDFGICIRLGCYEWIHGALPADIEKIGRIGGTMITEEAKDAHASEHLLELARASRAWMQRVHEAQNRRISDRSERASNAAKARWNRKKDTSRIPHGDATVQEESTVEDKRGKKVTTTTKAALPRFMVPERIPADAWAGFLEMRSKKRAPNTARALTGILKELDRLNGEGHGYGLVLDQSTQRGWTGVFPLKATESHFGGNGGIPKSDPGLCQRCQAKPVTGPYHWRWCSYECMKEDHEQAENGGFRQNGGRQYPIRA